MKHVRLAILAMTCLSTSAWAQTGPGKAGAFPQWRAQHSLFDGNAGRQMVPNANECASALPTAVWGANSTILGYSCENGSNGS
jgi:hypothetical protein